MRRALAGLVGLLLVVAGSVPAGAQPSAWVPTLPLNPYGPYYATAFAEGRAFVIQQDDAGDGVKLFRSSDYGTTWSPLPPLPVNGRVQADFLSPTRGFAAVNDKLIRTTDGGRTWTRVDAPWARPADIDFLDATDDGQTIVVGVQEWRELDGHLFRNKPDSCHDPRQDRLTIFVSRDEGGTWKRSDPLSYPVQVSDADFVDRRHGLVVVSDPVEHLRLGRCFFRAEVPTGIRTLITDDGGRTFGREFECHDGDGCLAVDRSSRNHIVIGSTGGSISASFDGGRTFAETRLEDGPIDSAADDFRLIFDIAFTNDLVGYAMTNGRGIFRTTDGGLTWVHEPSPLDAPGSQRMGPARLALADEHHAVAVGPDFVLTRVP